MSYPWIIIVPCVIFWIIVVVIVFLIITAKNNKIDGIVEKEIKDNLKKLNHEEYIWKNENNYINLKKEVRGCIMDNRKKYPSITRSYNNSSPAKYKEIYNIVKNYLEIDKKNKKED